MTSRTNQESVAGIRHWNIQAGHFFFRCRNGLFPGVFLLALLLMRPRVLFGRPGLDHLLTAAGILVAFAGEAVRLLTIGFDYIDRGGKNKRVAASRLVVGGMYGQSRNPMFVANLLIVTRICMAAGSPAGYLTVIPFFIFVYQAIASAEEEFLRKKFGREYDDYCDRVPHFLPLLRWNGGAFKGMRFEWRRAVRQDLSTILTVSMSLTLVPLWRIYFLEGPAAAKQMAPGTFARAAALLGFYAFLAYLKKSRRFFYPENAASGSR